LSETDRLPACGRQASRSGGISYFASQNAPQEKEVLPLPQPTRARATTRKIF